MGFNSEFKGLNIAAMKNYDITIYLYIHNVNIQITKEDFME